MQPTVSYEFEYDLCEARRGIVNLWQYQGEMNEEVEHLLQEAYRRVDVAYERVRLIWLEQHRAELNA